MKNTLKLVLIAAVSLPALAGCGLRGGLERADPIFRDVEPIEEPAPPEVEVRVRPRTNEVGGELPIPAPANEIQTADVPDLSN